jgi:SAM-dependent methyltransferase
VSGDETGALASGWHELAGDYELGRRKPDAFYRILDWPAELSVLGDVTGLDVLDVGCGSGAKSVELLERGASSVTGVDLAGRFVPMEDPRLTLIQADLSDLGEVPAIAGRRFDRIVFLQSLAYARDQVATLAAARRHLNDDGFIVIARSHPIRFAVERAEKNDTTIGQEYFSAEPYTYVSSWNEQISLTHVTNTVADMINTFAAAGLWIEHALEPQLSEEHRRQFPHKQAWLDRHLGIIVFRARPLAAR